MKNIMSLYGVLTKNAEMKVPKKGNKGLMYAVLGIVAVCCIMIPCCLIVGFVSYYMTEALKTINNPEAGLLAELHIMSAFSVVFGMLVVFNILFFSSDREHVMPLPFKSHEILLAKFLFSYTAESVMEFFVLLSMFIGYMLSYGFSATGIIASLFGIILIPLVPMAYCAIIGLVLLIVLKNIKNTKIFNYVSTILLAAFIILFVYSFKDMSGITVENYVNSLANNSNLFTNILNKVFFTVPLLTTALTCSGIKSLLNILIYIAASVGVVVIMAVIGKYSYQQALYTIGQLGNGSKKTSLKDVSKNEKGVFASYLKKELLVLTRTKAYNGNCVWINMLWPFALIVYVLMNQNKEGFIKLVNMFAAGNQRAYIFLTVAMVLLAFIASAMNSLASTAFTREGLHLDLVKYIPVSYKQQVFIKGFVAMLLTFPPMLLCSIISVIAFKISPLWILIHAIILFASLTFTTVLGLYLDSAHPHSDWDDEYSALRGNLNTFFDMALVMVISLLICGIGILLNYFVGFGLVPFHIYILFIVIIMAVVSVLIGKDAIPQNIDDL